MVIPRIIHRIWVGGPEPAWLHALRESWLQHHPEWVIWDWTDDTIGDLFPLRNQDLYDRADELAGKFAGQFRSDVARIEILERYGGVYVDCDMEALHPLDETLAGVDCWAAWEIHGRVVNNAICGSIAGHPFLRRLIDGLAGSVGDGGRPSKVSGPHYWTRVHREHPGELIVFPQHLFYPYGCRELDRGAETYPDALAVHHWANQRQLRKKPL